MRTSFLFMFATVLGVSPVLAQQPAAPNPASQPFVAGTPLKQQPNVKTYGGFRFAESVAMTPSAICMWRSVPACRRRWRQTTAMFRWSTPTARRTR